MRICNMKRCHQASTPRTYLLWTASRYHLSSVVGDEGGHYITNNSKQQHSLEDIVRHDARQWISAVVLIVWEHIIQRIYNKIYPCLSPGLKMRLEYHQTVTNDNNLNSIASLHCIMRPAHLLLFSHMHQAFWPQRAPWSHQEFTSWPATSNIAFAPLATMSEKYLAGWKVRLFVTTELREV